MSVFFVLILLLIASITAEECVRHRKSWLLLTQEEKELYIEGFQKIRKNGKMDIITQAHSNADVVPSVHYTSFFTYWHSYLVWEVETAIRDLGGKFECFGMPYWDWTLDAGLEDNPPILQSGIGGDGVESNDYCVGSDGTGSNWNVCDDPLAMNSLSDQQCYWSPISVVEGYCSAQETAPYCCLKRSKSETVLLKTAATLGHAIREYYNFREFQSYINLWHNHCHTLLASVETAHMVDGFAPDDPVFMMLHAYVDYLRNLWADCWDYDEIAVDLLDKHYDAYHPYCGVVRPPDDMDCPNYDLGLDDAFKVYELRAASWSKAHNEDITVRKLWNPTEWNVVYELGSFFTTSGTNNWCADNLNSQWFVKTMDYDEDIVNTPVNQYSAELWTQLKDEEIDEIEIFRAVSALSCDFTRKNSGNSCWSSEIDDIDKEICDEKISDDELDEIGLNDMLNFNGIKDNECLQQIRRDIFPYSAHFSSVKKQLCFGDFDYKCPIWKPKYEKYAINDDSTSSSKNDAYYSLSLQLWIIILVIIILCGCIISYYANYVKCCSCFFYVIKERHNKTKKQKKKKNKKKNRWTNNDFALYGSV